MMRQILALLVLAAFSFAAMDQNYTQVVNPDGSSTIQKTMEITMFANQLPASSLKLMAAYCASNADFQCSVDVAGKTLTIAEDFQQGEYYTSSSDFGIPFITYSIQVQKIPNDIFGDDLEKMLLAANISSMGGQPVDALDLSDQANNPQSAAFLRKLNTSMTYTITMPAGVYSATSGNYTAKMEGQTAAFDLVEVLNQSEPMTIVARQVNSAAIVAIIGVIVLAALAISFFSGKPSKGKAKARRKK